MSKFIVMVPEVWINNIEIEAKDEKAAYFIVEQMYNKAQSIGDSNKLEFSHAQFPDTWDIKKVSE